MIKFSLRFDRKKEAPKKGKGLVQIECYQNGVRKYLTTTLYLTTSQWDTKKNQPKDNVQVLYLRKKLNDLEEFQRERIKQFGECLLDDLQHFIPSKPKAEPKPTYTFTEFFTQQLKEESSLLKFNSLKNDQTLLKRLTEFRPVVQFSDLNYAFVDAFDKYLAGLGNNHTTRNKRHKTLSKYFRKAVKYKHLQQNPYEEFEKPKAKNREVFLTTDERNRFESLTFDKSNSNAEMVRDMYLFSVYTGLRWGDMAVLQQSHFVQTAKGLLLDIVTAKTQERLQLHLEDVFDGRPADIIRRYWGDEADKPFFSISNQKANKHLKILAEKANISKKLRYHSSRHTSATVYAKCVGVLNAKSILQHKDLKTTEHYLHLAQTERDEAIRQVKKWE